MGISGRQATGFVLLIVGVLVGIAAELVPAMAVPNPPYLLLALDAAVGYAYIAAGLLARARAPGNRSGPLLIAIGLTWFIGNFRFGPAGIADVAVMLRDVTNVLLIYLLLAYPSGRLRTPLHRAAVAIVAVTLVGPAVLASILGTPRLTFMAVPSEPDEAGLSAVIGVGIAVGLLVLLARRWLTATGPARRTLTPVIAGGAVIVGAILSVQLRQLLVIPEAAHEGISWLLLVGRILVPLGLLAGLLRLQMARSSVADLIVQLGDLPTAENLQRVLSVALGDPSLVVWRWDPASGGFVDANGARAALPADASHGVTILDGQTQPLAAIVHDPALLEDAGLLASVAGAIRLAVENERLTAAVEDQLEEVRASRTRIVEAADAERRRVERDLHDGAQQRLVSLALSLRLARTRLGPEGDPAVRASLEAATEEAKSALAELRELARGIHPQILTEAGLAAAVQSLADRSSIDIEIEIDASRYSPAVEGAAYFVISEALANVAKYAGAKRTLVRADWAAGELKIEISDDGVGGADPSSGSGLRGLADRLASIDGQLEVASPLGSGTRLVAHIPSPAPLAS